MKVGSHQCPPHQGSPYPVPGRVKGCCTHSWALIIMWERFFWGISLGRETWVLLPWDRRRKQNRKFFFEGTQFLPEREYRLKAILTLAFYWLIIFTLFEKGLCCYLKYFYMVDNIVDKVCDIVSMYFSQNKINGKGDKPKMERDHKND